MAFDRIKLLILSGICLLISVFSMNTCLLAVSVTFFITVALYNIMVMLQNNTEILKKANAGKLILLHAVLVIGCIGILLAVFGLFLSLKNLP